MASKMAVAKPNIRKFPLFQCFLTQINVILTKNMCWDPWNGFEKYWTHVAMVTTILPSLSLKEVVKFVKLPQISRTRLLQLLLSRHMVLDNIGLI